ncbi:hypothetical protein GF340_03010 [Candidatus Peregrinibacteria bacterium]|nr:hypothetical protein [Candidatus Peregrinibacteria bacterium]
MINRELPPFPEEEPLSSGVHAKPDKSPEQAMDYNKYYALYNALLNSEDTVEVTKKTLADNGVESGDNIPTEAIIQLVKHLNTEITDEKKMANWSYLRKKLTEEIIGEKNKIALLPLGTLGISNIVGEVEYAPELSLDVLILDENDAVISRDYNGSLVVQALSDDLKNKVVFKAEPSELRMENRNNVKELKKAYMEYLNAIDQYNTFEPSTEIASEMTQVVSLTDLKEEGFDISFAIGVDEQTPSNKIHVEDNKGDADFDDKLNDLRNSLG